MKRTSYFSQLVQWYLIYCRAYASNAGSVSVNCSSNRFKAAIQIPCIYRNTLYWKYSRTRQLNTINQLERLTDTAAQQYTYNTAITLLKILCSRVNVINQQSKPTTATYTSTVTMTIRSGYASHVRRKYNAPGGRIGSVTTDQV